MFYRIDFLISFLDRVLLRAWIAAICLSLLGAQTPLLAQTPCTDYNQCAALQGEDSRGLNGPITFSFNMQSLNDRFPDPADRNDFMTQMRAAAADWAGSTGIGISEAPPGQTGNVTIRVEPSESAPGSQRKPATKMDTLILIRRATLRVPIAPWAYPMSGVRGALPEGTGWLRTSGDTSWDLRMFLLSE